MVRVLDILALLPPDLVAYFGLARNEVLALFLEEFSVLLIDAAEKGLTQNLGMLRLLA